MKLLELQKMILTIHELIEFIKLRGEVINTENSVFGIENDKYIERALLCYDGNYFVTYSILDNFIDRCYFEDMAEYDNEYSATVGYNNLFIHFNGAL